MAAMDECIKELHGKLSYKVMYGRFPLKILGDTVDLGFTTVRSLKLARALSGCESALIFGATVGIGIDRLISKYSVISPSRAYIFQAIGAERIESLCDAFIRDISEDLAKEGLAPRPRFSPGYGDLSLELQRDIFKALDCERGIGLTLNASLIMSPSKSVTAVVGLYRSEE